MSSSIVHITLLKPGMTIISNDGDYGTISKVDRDGITVQFDPNYFCVFAQCGNYGEVDYSISLAENYLFPLENNIDIVPIWLLKIGMMTITDNNEYGIISNFEFDDPGSPKIGVIFDDGAYMSFSRCGRVGHTGHGIRLMSDRNVSMQI
jgi:hypothetical protein